MIHKKIIATKYTIICMPSKGKPLPMSVGDTVFVPSVSVYNIFV